MFKTRLISGVLLVLFALIVIITGGKVLLITTFALSMVGAFEIYRAFGMEKEIITAIGYVAIAIYYFLFDGNAMKTPVLFVVLLLMALLLLYVITYPKYNADAIAKVLFGFVYVGLLISFVYQTRVFFGYGPFLVWLIFLSSWGADTCAYCVGMLFGKHKMAPVLSPKKSIEGAVGGVLGSVLLTAIYYYVYSRFFSLPSILLTFSMIIALAGSVISMFGHLAASAIKRNYDIKDYGTLIPGHGGILDRFDSVFFTAPVVFCLAIWLF